MKKGFTLVEVLAVIIILGIMALLIIPSAFEMVQSSKQKMYDQQLEEIRATGMSYAFANIDEDAFKVVGVPIVKTLQDLSNEGYIELPIPNYLTGEDYDPSKVEITITKKANGNFNVVVAELP